MLSFDSDGQVGQLRYAGRHRKTPAQVRPLWLPYRRGATASASPNRAGDGTLSEDRAAQRQAPANS
jgi:hypothetical protein